MFSLFSVIYVKDDQLIGSQARIIVGHRLLSARQKMIMFHAMDFAGMQIFFTLSKQANQIMKLTRFYLTFSECLILNWNKTMATLPCKIGPCMNHISHEVTVVPKFTLPNTLEVRVVYILWSCFSNCQGTEFCIVNK